MELRFAARRYICGIMNIDRAAIQSLQIEEIHYLCLQASCCLRFSSSLNIFSQFSSVPWPVGSLGGHEGQFSSDPLPVFSAQGPCQQFWHGQGCPLFGVVHPAFPLLTTVLPTLQGALKDGFGEAAVVCDTLEPCKFPSPDSCQKRFFWTYKRVDLAPHSVVGLMLQVGDAEKFHQTLGFKSLDPFFRVSKQGPCFTAMEEDGGDKRLVELEYLQQRGKKKKQKQLNPYS